MNLYSPHIKFIDKTKENFNNYSHRAKHSIIDTIIIHYTFLDFEDSLYTLTKGKVSSHYLIDRDGSIYYLVEKKNKAWHAGKSFWRDKENINDNSIGIELVNKGQELNVKGKKFYLEGYESFTDSQYQSLNILIKQLKADDELAIQNRNIIGHSDITAYNLRKIDPGLGFNWHKLYQEGHGLYYQTNDDEDFIICKYLDAHDDIGCIQQKFADIGYKIDISNQLDEQTANIMLAFNMHFNQKHCLQNEIGNKKYLEYGNWRNSANKSLNFIHKQIDN